MSPSIWQILLVVAIIAILFLRPKTLPTFGTSLGDAIKNFKKALNGDKENEIDVTDSTKRDQIDQSTTSETEEKKEESSSKSETKV